MSTQETPVRRAVKWLFQIAMLVFVVTVTIGMLNGLKLMTFTRPELMAHVHAGTLGWITLGVLGVHIWLFRDPARNSYNTLLVASGALAALSFPLYVYAFYANQADFRAWASVPVFLAIMGFFVWVLLQARQMKLGIAHWALLGAMLNLTVGALMGALIQFQVATKVALLPDGATASHPTTMTIGYLILVGMAFAEWRFIPQTAKLSRAGIAQIALPFAGGVLLTLGTLLNIMPLIFSATPLEIIGVVIFVARFARHWLGTHWLERAPDRQFALSGVFVVVNVALLAYLIVQYATGAYGNPPDFKLIPYWMIFGMDHAIFIGVMTNALFGFIQIASASAQSFVAWTDDVLFWGMNIGMIGFVGSLLASALEFEKIFTPLMGTSILLAIAVYSVRLQKTMKESDR